MEEEDITMAGADQHKFNGLYLVQLGTSQYYYTWMADIKLALCSVSAAAVLMMLMDTLHQRKESREQRAEEIASDVKSIHFGRRASYIPSSIKLGERWTTHDRRASSHPHKQATLATPQFKVPKYFRLSSRQVAEDSLASASKNSNRSRRLHAPRAQRSEEEGACMKPTAFPWYLHQASALLHMSPGLSSRPWNDSGELEPLLISDG